MLSAMLFPTLLAALAAEPAAPDALLHVIPTDALAAVRINDARATMARRETSNWVGFLTDPQWQNVMALTRDLDGGELGGDGAQAREVARELMDAMALTTGTVAFIGGDPETDEEPEIGFVALCGDALVAPLTKLMRTDAAPVVDGELSILAHEGGVFEAYVRRGDLHVCVNGDDAVQRARAILARYDASAPVESPFDRLAASADVQALLNLGRLWGLASSGNDIPSPFMGIWEAIASIEWCHVRVQLGDGEDFSVEFELPYSEDTLFGKIDDLARKADTSKMDLAPMIAVSTNVASFDLAGFVNIVLEDLAERAPDEHQMVSAALESAKEGFGIDVLGEIVGGLTGETISFVLPVDSNHAEGGASPAAISRSCIAVGIRDAEPFLEAVETAVEMAGLGAMLETSTLRGAEVFSTEVDGLYVALAVSNDYLVLAYDTEALEVFLARANEDEDAPRGFLGRAAMAEEAQRLEGSYVSLGSTRNTLRFLGDAFAAMGGFAESQAAGQGPDAEATARRMAELARELGFTTSALADRYFDGFLNGSLTMKDGRILMRTRSN